MVPSMTWDVGSLLVRYPTGSNQRLENLNFFLLWQAHAFRSKHAKKLPPMKFCKHPTEPYNYMDEF